MPPHAVNPAAVFSIKKSNLRQSSHPLLGDCSKTVLDIRAETTRKAPVVPDLCHIYFDRRFLPGETKESVLGEFNALIESAKKEIPDFKASAEITKWGIELYTPEEEPIVEAISKARTAVLGDAGQKSAWIFGTDGAFVAAHGIPTVGFGPGDEQYAHTPDDHIPLSHLEKAARIYAECARIVCCES